MKMRANTYKSVIIAVCLSMVFSTFGVAVAHAAPTELTGNIQYTVIGGDGATAPLKNAKIMLFCESELKYPSGAYYDSYSYEKQGRFTNFVYTDENGNFTLPLDFDGVDIAQYGQIYLGVCGLSFMRQSYMQELSFEKRRDYFFTPTGGDRAVRFSNEDYTSPWKYEYYNLYAIDLSTEQTKDVVLENIAKPFDGSVSVYLTSDILCDWGLINTNLAARFTVTRQSDNAVIFEYDGMDFTTANDAYPMPVYDKSKYLCTFSGLSADDSYILEATAVHRDTGEPIPEFVPAQSMLVIDGALLNTYETLPYFFIENKKANDVPSDIWNGTWNWNNYVNGANHTVHSPSSNLYRTIDGVRYNYNFEVEDGRIVNDPYMVEIEFDDALVVQSFERYSAEKESGAFDINLYDAAGNVYYYKTAFPAYTEGVNNYIDTTLPDALGTFRVKRAVIRYNKEHPFDNLDAGVRAPTMDFVCTVDPASGAESVRNKITITEDLGFSVISRSTFVDMPVAGGAYNVAIDTKQLEGSNTVPFANIPIDIYSYQYNQEPVFLMHTTSNEDGVALVRLPNVDYADYVLKFPNIPDDYNLVTSGYSIDGTTHYDGMRTYTNPDSNNIPAMFVLSSVYAADSTAASYNRNINGSLGETVSVNISGIQAHSMFKNFELVAYIPPGFTIQSVEVPAYDKRVGYNVETMAASKSFNPVRNVFSALDMPMQPLRTLPYYTDAENVIPITQPDEDSGNRVVAVKLTFDSSSFGFMPNDGVPITLDLLASTDIADFTQIDDSTVAGNIDLQINKRYAESTLNRSVTDLRTVPLTLGTDIGTLRISCTDANHNPLAGAKFALYESDMQTTVLADITTNAEGTAMVSHIAPGAYYVKQTATLSDYIADNTAYPVQISNTEPYDITIINTRRSGGGGTNPTPPPIQPPVDEYETHVQYISGRPGNIFDPDSPITRAEVAQILYNVSEDTGKATAATADFPDIAQGEWYSESVNYIAARGIMTGYEDGTFRPHDTISRAELAKCVALFSDLGTAYSINPFPDVIAGYWAEPYIAAQSSRNWVVGYPDGLFRPENGATRAEAVTITNRMLDRKVKNIDLLMPGIRQLSDVGSNYWAYADIMEAYNTHKYTRESDGFEAWVLLM